MPTLSSPRSLLLLAALVLLPGCLDEQDTITVHADGSGTIRVRQRQGPLAGTFLRAAQEEGKAPSTDGLAARRLAGWEGVCAWTDVKVEGDLFEATGWFEDLNALGAERGQRPFRWTSNADGSRELEAWCSPPGVDAGGPLESIPDALTLPLLTLALKDLRIERTIELPGAIDTSTGGRVAPRSPR